MFLDKLCVPSNDYYIEFLDYENINNEYFEKKFFPDWFSGKKKSRTVKLSQSSKNEGFDKRWVDISQLDLHYLHDESILENDFLKLTNMQSLWILIQVLLKNLVLPMFLELFREFGISLVLMVLFGFYFYKYYIFNFLLLIRNEKQIKSKQLFSIYKMIDYDTLLDDDSEEEEVEKEVQKEEQKIIEKNRKKEEKQKKKEED